MPTIPITRPDLPPLPEYVALLERIWGSRMLSNFASFAKELEAIASAYLGAAARTVVSGDIGLVAALSALDVPAGSTCLVPSFTFSSTVNAVLWNNLVPVFVDIDPDTLNMDPVDAARKADDCRPKVVLATHVFGNPADADGLRQVARAHGAALVFDAAHGYGATRRGVHVGALGDVEVFSLSGTKPVTCAEGGLVTARDPDFLDRFEYARAYGFRTDYNTKRLGLNGKMSELHAALGTLTLPRIESALARRARAVALYRDLLADTPGIRFQRVDAADRSTFKDLALLFDDRRDRDAAREALDLAGVQTKCYFRPCHRMTAFKPLALDPLPVTDRTSERVLCVPLYADLDDADIQRIAEIVAHAVRARRAGADPTSASRPRDVGVAPPVPVA